MGVFNDREGHDELYAAKDYSDVPREREAFVRWYEATRLRAVHAGGPERGRVRNLAVEALLADVRPGFRYMEAGCGVGLLSAYLAIRGVRMTGIDISPVGVAWGRALAADLGLCNLDFRAEDLGALSDPTSTYRGIIAHASLHHFVKYPGVPESLGRVLCPDGTIWFSDGFAENRLYRLFHDRDKMERLGDVLLTKRLIHDTFGPVFDVDLRPADWFLMVSKWQMRVSPAWATRWVRAQARLHLALDRRMPSNRATLALAGSVLVTLRHRHATT